MFCQRTCNGQARYIVYRADASSLSLIFSPATNHAACSLTPLWSAPGLTQSNAFFFQCDADQCHPPTLPRPARRRPDELAFFQRPWFGRCRFSIVLALSSIRFSRTLAEFSSFWNLQYATALATVFFFSLLWLTLIVSLKNNPFFTYGMAHHYISTPLLMFTSIIDDGR
jgi:hypothetical protein